MNENKEAGAAAGASPHLVKAWRRISTDEIGLHVSAVELRREVNATESLMLSRQQARRLATDIYELLADDDPAGASVAPQPDWCPHCGCVGSHWSDCEYEKFTALSRAGASVSVAPQRPFSDARSLLIADFVLAIDFEHKTLQLEPAQRAINRFLEAGAADRTRLRTALQRVINALKSVHVVGMTSYEADDLAKELAAVLALERPPRQDTKEEETKSETRVDSHK